MTIYAGDAQTLDRRTMLDIPADSGDVFDASFGGALSTNPSSSIVRTEQLQQAEEGRRFTGDTESILVPPRLEPDTPLIDAAQATAQAKAAGFDLKIPAQGIRQGALDILIDRQREQAARQQVMARAASGTLPAQIAAGLGASLLDPLNIASAFVPVVGEARYASMLAGASGAFGRAGIRAGVGAAEGAVGAAILEPLPLMAAQQDQTEYGLSDSLANIAMGGVLGGGLHAIGGAVSDALRRRLASETPTQRPDAMLDQPGLPRTEGTTPDLGRLFDDDPDTALRTSLQRGIDADQENLRQTAQVQAIEEIRPTLSADRVGNVRDLKLEGLSITDRLMALDDTFKQRASDFQGPRVSRKQAERQARDAIAAEREQLQTRQAQINTEIERNRAGEFNRADLAQLDRGVIPERLQPQIEARTRQIMQGYQQRPLGAAIRTARETAEDAQWTTRDAALRTAVAQSVSGRDVDVQNLFDLADPAKAPAAMDALRQPQARRLDPAGLAESRRVDEIPEAIDDIEEARAALAEDEANVKQLLDQLDPESRDAIEAIGREQDEASAAYAAKAQQYSKAYQAAAACELRNA
ncbi:hypothetical protein [Pseudomonas typographi]|uniref:hypothetical protein n=1 Tax=Pseudomonas typographi TaxID=2715964 RepID=UPI001687F485|nr:hypothetical protein [Pseudomonas typographi]